MTVLFVATVVMNGGDHAIVEAQRIVAGVSAEEVVLYTDRPRPSAALLPHLRFREQPYHAFVGVGPASFVTRVRRRLTAARIIIAATLWRTGVGRLLVSAPERQLLREWADAEVVLYTGGTSLVENYWLLPRLFDLRLANALGTPYVMMTQSLGPFTKSEVIRPLRRLLSGADAVLLRDERSLRHVEELGIETRHCHVLPDLAFALADEERVRSGFPSVVRPRRVVVSVREWAFYGHVRSDDLRVRYHDAIRAIVRELVVAHDADVTFLSTCQGIPDYWTDDSREAQAVVAGLEPEVAMRVTVRTDRLDPASLRDTYGEADLVVATRLHAAILALCAGTPVLPIAYEFKTQEVFHQLGLGATVLDIHDLDPSAMPAALDHALKAWSDCPHDMAEAVLAMRDGALTAREYVTTARRRS